MPPRGQAAEQNDGPDLGMPQEDPNVTIDLDAEPDDDAGTERTLEGGTQADDEPRQRERDPKTGKWADKKRQKGTDRRDERAWRTEKTQMETRIQTMQREHQQQMQAFQMRMDAAMRAPAGGGQQQPATDPYAAQISDIQAQISTELQLIEKDNGRDLKRYLELQDKKSELIAERTWARKNAGQQRPQQQAQQSPYAARQPFIESEFPWTMDPANGELCKRAAAIKQYLVNVEGRLDTIDTDREALSTAASRFGSQFGIQAPAALPSQRTRDFYGGPGQRTAPRREGARPREIQVPKSLLNGSGLSAAAIADALRED